MVVGVIGAKDVDAKILKNYLPENTKVIVSNGRRNLTKCKLGLGVCIRGIRRECDDCSENECHINIDYVIERCHKIVVFCEQESNEIIYIKEKCKSLGKECIVYFDEE